MLKQLDVLIGFAVVMSIVSMLIMVINQMVLSGLQLRGKQLMDALEAMFKTLKPDLGEKAKALAEAVLRHPVISDSAKSGDKRGLASAIRPEELLAILKKLEASADDPDKWIGNKTLKHADEALVRKDDRTPEQQNDKPIITTLAGAARDVLGILEQPDQAVTQANQQLSTVIATLPEAIKNNIQTLQARATINVQTTLQRVEKWFGTVEDRAREWFATRAQQCNVVIAVCLVLCLQLDAFKLYRQLQSDDAYRSALVGSAATVQKQAQELKEHADKAAQAANKESAATEFDYWTKAANDVRKKTAELDKDIQGQGFQIFPASYPGTLWEWLGWATRHDSNSSKPSCCLSIEGLSFSVSHFLGMAFFAALLSLGAPYWFNLLKTLTSFRPLLAQEVDKDKAKKGNTKTTT
jgi:hypothetical protein